MSALVIAGSFALVFGLALIVRRASVLWLGAVRGLRPERPIIDAPRPAGTGQPGEPVVVGRIPARSDRRILTPSRSRR
jgi:hypothetical protein